MDAQNEKRVKIARELFETYEKQFEASKVRLLQLMQSENQLFTTELEQINSHYRMKMAELTIMASTGSLLSGIQVTDTGAAKAEASVETTAAVDMPVSDSVPSVIDPERELSKPAGK
jgi:Outer membrane efflux protein